MCITSFIFNYHIENKLFIGYLNHQDTKLYDTMIKCDVIPYLHFFKAQKVEGANVKVEKKVIPIR